MLISQVDLLNQENVCILLSASKGIHSILIDISHDYKVVITPFSYHLSIVKLIILLNDCNGQVLSISAGNRGDLNQ
jgi:hypothetical protein